MSVLIDTHIWIWWVTEQEDLGSTRTHFLDDLAKSGKPPCLAAISLWEAQMLARKGRLKLNLDFASWLLAASDPQVVRLLPLDASVVLAADSLPEGFHGDPADRLIVATAIAHTLKLMTDDKAIRGSKLVEVAT